MRLLGKMDGRGILFFIREIVWGGGLWGRFEVITQEIGLKVWIYNLVLGLKEASVLSVMRD